jgi:hypothetical protein
MSTEQFRNAIIIMQASIWTNTCQEFDFRDFPVLYYEEMEVVARALDLFSDKNIECQLFPLLRDLFDLRPSHVHVPVRHFYYGGTPDRRLDFYASLRHTYWNHLMRQRSSNVSRQRARALAQIPVPVLMKLMDAVVRARRNHYKRNREWTRKRLSQRYGDIGKERQQGASARNSAPATRCTESELAEALDEWYKYLISVAGKDTETTNPEWHAFWVEEFGLEEEHLKAESSRSESSEADVPHRGRKTWR